MINLPDNSSNYLYVDIQFIKIFVRFLEVCELITSLIAFKTN